MPATSSRSEIAKPDVEGHELFLVERAFHDRHAEVDGDGHRSGERGDEPETQADSYAEVADGHVLLDVAGVAEGDQEELVVGEHRDLVFECVQVGESAADVEAVFVRADAAEREAAQAVEAAAEKALVDRDVRA